MELFLRDVGATLNVADDRLVSGHRAVDVPNLSDVSKALLDALEEPINFPPLRRALTPDDRVAIVIDERLPQLALLIARLVEALAEFGINPAAITLVSAGGTRQAWVDELPDSAQDVHIEVHDPSNRKAVSYLASTRKGRRIYLNRTVVEAEQTIVLAGCRYDAAAGLYDGVVSLFPTLSDSQTLADPTVLPGRVEFGSPGAGYAEALEVAWLLGVPFFVHLIEGTGDGLASIQGGTVESIDHCHQLLARRWQTRFDRPAQLVIATLTGDPQRQDFAALAQSAHAAAQVVEPSGRIVLLSQGQPPHPQIIELLRQADDLDSASRRVREQADLPDQRALLQWINAARTANLYLLSQWSEELAEELGVTPLQQASQVQRLIDAASSCLVIDDAHRAFVSLD